MALEIRPARADEMGQFGLIGAYVFAGSFGDGPDNRISQLNRPEWTQCAFIDGRMATSFAAIPFTMRANGKAVPIGGVTAVGTLPEFRRQGHLRAVMTQAFATLRDQQRPVATLWASQAAIYQRYGYALATQQVAYRIDTVDVGFADGDAGGCHVARMPADEAYDTIRQIYIDFIAPRSGYLHRSKVLWLNGVLASDATTGPAFVAVARDAGGQAVGHVIYGLRGDRTGHPTRNQEIVVRDLAWLTVDAWRSLWTWLRRHDLVGRIHWPRAPVDDPAPELFVEPRLLNVQVRDGIWLRIVDVPGALAARGYDVDDTITLQVEADALAPWNSGRYRLECSADGARVSSTMAAADVVLGIKALASLWSGARTPRQLHTMGLLQADEAALARAARVFSVRHAPHCPDSF